jgi:hypothetical protein|tara:strand:- start:6204 stop:6464 length:261 start_codon:yes stop_codon:yes gene_type:complete
MDSNTAFLDEKPIRKRKIHTLYGFFLCTQFSSLLEFFRKKKSSRGETSRGMPHPGWRVGFRAKRENRRSHGWLDFFSMYTLLNIIK